MACYEDGLEEDRFYAIPMVGPVLQGCKRKIGHDAGDDGTSNSKTSAAVVARSWLNLKKLTEAKLDLANEPLPEGLEQAEAWTTRTKKLARQLEEKLKIMEEGLRLKVVDA
jgi:hypothetical protein